MRENFALQKGPLVTFVLPYKRVRFWPQKALQQGLFQPKMKVSPLKHASLANVKLNNFLKCTEWYVLGHFLVSFSQIFALQKGKIFGANAFYLRMGFQISKSHTRIKISVTQKKSL